MSMGVKILVFIIGYAFGTIPSGYLLGKSKHVDIRKHGSGNTGATNTLRVMGNVYGFMTLFFDCMKAVIPALIIWYAFKASYDAEHVRLLMLYTATGAVFGHDFPAEMKFKGGKGISTSLGLFIVAFPQIIPLEVVIFVLTVAISRYVSLGSILCAIAYPIQVIIFALIDMHVFGGPQMLYFYHSDTLIEAVVIAFLTGGLAVCRHHSNISRLAQHKENKFSFHHKEVE